MIIPDLRGHGESDVEDGITLHNFAQDILDLLDKLHIEQAHFCGLSLGGIVVQEILRLDSNRVKSLIMSNTASFMPSYIVSTAVDNSERKLNSISDDEYIKFVASKCIYDKHNDELMCKAIQTFKINRNTYPSAARAGIGINYLPMLAMNTVQKLIIGSLQDEVTPYANAWISYANSKNAQLKTIYNCGHLSNIEKSEEFNDTLLDFLSKL